ncbi:MAG: hypothetical protein HUU11_09840 [Anaerolineales bacterium]|nr:hypothetical protein [Anaerolineales bacterium]
MRRIIERVVTVVTTTTWTIYWKDDPLPSDPQADSVPQADRPENAAPALPSEDEPKEVDRKKARNTPSLL